MIIFLGLLLAAFMLSLFQWGVAVGYSKGVRDVAKMYDVEVPPLSKRFPFQR